MTETRPGPLASPHGHPDIDTLADYDAGVLDQARSTRLRSHVSACERCQAILAGIGDVPGLLRRLPPPRIPPDVEARIFAALDAERLARFGPTAAPTAAPAPTRASGRVEAGSAAGSVTSLAAARQRRAGRARLVALVAAGLVVIAGGATAVISLTGHPASNGTTAGPALSEGQQNDASGPAVKATGLPSYNRQTITSSSLLISILNGERGPLVAGGVLDQARLRSCASGVARVVPGLTGTPRGVQHISFEGKPAYLLAYAGAGGRALVVVGEACSGEDPDVLYARTL